MIPRLLISLALLGSAAAGVGAGLLLSQAPDDSRHVKSITGITSGTDGSHAKQPEEKGVDQVSLPPKTPPTTDPSPQPDAAPQRTMEIVSSNAGAMQSIRGIKGIDTVMLQNLEAVLRMQAPPPPPEGGGGRSVRAAAALLTMESDEPPEPEEETDGRQELTEIDLKGS